MKYLIFAAGYATQFYPLTENFPNSLLSVRDKTILDWLLAIAGDNLLNFSMVDFIRYQQEKQPTCIMQY